MFEALFGKSEFAYLLIFALVSVCCHAAMIARNAYYDPNDPKSRANPVAQLYHLDQVADLDVKWVNRMIGYPQILGTVLFCIVGRFSITAGALGLLASTLLLSNASMHIVGSIISRRK